MNEGLSLVQVFVFRNYRATLKVSQVWWGMFIIPAPLSIKEENCHKFEDSRCYVARSRPFKGTQQDSLWKNKLQGYHDEVPTAKPEQFDPWNLHDGRE